MGCFRVDDGCMVSHCLSLSAKPVTETATRPVIITHCKLAG